MIEAWLTDEMNLGVIICASLWFAFAYNLALGTFAQMQWRRPQPERVRPPPPAPLRPASLYPECLDCDVDAVWHETDPDNAAEYNGRSYCIEHRPHGSPSMIYRDRRNMKPSPTPVPGPGSDCPQ